MRKTLKHQMFSANNTQMPWYVIKNAFMFDKWTQFKYPNT